MPNNNNNDSNRNLRAIKAIELDNSETFNVHRWSVHIEVNNAVDQIFNELVPISVKKYNKKVRKCHIKVIILDLYVKWLKDPSIYVSFSRRNEFYKPKSRYNKLHVSKLTPQIVDLLEQLGYLTQHLGFLDRRTGNSRVSRMKATDKLIDLIVDRFHVTENMVELAPDTECIILRNIAEGIKGREDIEYVDESDPRIVQWRKCLYAYNNLLRLTNIEIPSCPAEGIPTKNPNKFIIISDHDKFIRRIFNNGSWDEGGRFFGGFWQRIASEWRKKIRILKHPVTEIDYDGLHIKLLYLREGMAYDEDPYKLDGIEQSERMRSLLKLILLSSINAASKGMAKKAVQQEINFNQDEFSWVKSSGIKLGEIIDAFAVKHELISKYLFSGSGVRLQNLDSMIAEKVINHFTRQKIPVLCVHDSFLIQGNKGTELQSVMNTAFIESLRELGIDTTNIPSKSIEGIGLNEPYAVTTDLSRKRDILEMHGRAFEYPKWWEQHEKIERWRLEGDYYGSKSVL